MNLLITADDFGVNAARDKGIIEAVHRGAVSHLPMVVNGESTPGAAQFAREVPPEKCSVGLHINLSEGVPLVATAPALVRGGRFLGKEEFLTRNGFDTTNDVLVGAMEEETVAQLREFARLTGIRRFRVDGHHHCHVFPAVARAICGAVCKVKDDGIEVLSVRVPNDLAFADRDPALADLGSSEKPLTKDECFGEPFWALVAHLADASRADYQRAGVDVGHAFIGLDMSGARCRAQVMFERLEAAAASGVERIEVMTHVGDHWDRDPTDEYFHCFFSCSPERGFETEQHYELLQLTGDRWPRVPDN